VKNARQELNLRMSSQGECEGRSPAELALDADAPTVGFHNVLDDGEAQTRAAGLTRARLIHTVEPLEDSGLILRHDPDSRVLNVYGDESVVESVRSPLCTAANRRILDRVVDQIDHNLLDLIVIRVDREARRNCSRQLNLRLLRLRAKSRNDLFQQLR